MAFLTFCLGGELAGVVPEGFEFDCRATGEPVAEKRAVRAITKKVFLRAKNFLFFGNSRNARKYWVKLRFFHKDSSKKKIVSILP
jgi:hypothetical protein